MAYNNYTGYPYPQMNYGFPYQGQGQQRNGIIWVSGEAGAKAYLVAPNSSVVLFDSESNTIYIKSADASGLPNIKTLDYTVRNEASQASHISPVSDYATKEDVSVIKEELDALRAKFEVKEGGKK